VNWSLTEWLTGLFDKVLLALQELAAWLWEGLQYLLVLALETVLSGAALLIESLPEVPQADALVSAFNGIPASVWWAISWAQFGTGLGMVGAAYALRFMIRRLPFVG
jgi:hypothetical protein